LALFVIRMAYITDLWLESRQDIADVRQVLMPITPGSRVLSVEASRYESNHAVTPRYRTVAVGLPPRTIAAYWHFAAFALIDHRAYWSDGFAIPGQQPVLIRPPYNLSGDGGVSAPPLFQSLPFFADAA